MSLQRNSRISKGLATGIALLLMVSPCAMSQDNSVQETGEDRTETIDEIVVFGDKSLVRLRQELYRAEEAAFDLFNLLNSDDEYDIHCYYETPIGSHIKQRVCKPNYARKLAAAATAKWLVSRQAGAGQAYRDALPQIQQKDALLRAEMEELVVRQPELQKALSEFSEAKRILEEERQRRCEGRIIICRR